jgi:hypothetical protein
MSDQTLPNVPAVINARIISNPVSYKGVPVMTTEMLAQAFGTDEARIRQNFANNKTRFTDGVHFFKVKGAELKALKTESLLATQFDKRAPALLLWTEKGAARHAKILDTNEAWGVYEQLEDTYFAVKEFEKVTGYGAKELNAVSRFLSIVNATLPNLSDRSRQSLIATTTEKVLGVALVPMPVVDERFWTTTEVASEVGVHATVAGRVANVHGLKTSDNGETRLGQSQHGAKQIEQWYWNAKGRDELLAVLKARN